MYASGCWHGVVEAVCGVEGGVYGVDDAGCDAVAGP